MVDKSENILVEFDYNNISIIDPNKVIDNDGKVQERYVKQENLVMYVNLEADLIPSMTTLLFTLGFKHLSSIFKIF